MQLILVQIALILILISLNGFFALAELAILSAKKLRLQELANRGDERAKSSLELVEESTTFLSNVQIGITMVGVASGTIGGATIAASFADAIKEMPLAGNYADSISIAVVIVSITFLSLVVGELVPKRIALSNPERFALLVAPGIKWLSKVFSPISNLLSRATDSIIGWIGVDTENQPDMSLDELRLMIDAGRISGILEPIEEMMLEQVLRFNNVGIKTLSTPRTEIAWLDVNTSQEKIKEFLIHTTFEKIPITEGDLDNLLGLVYVQKLLSLYLQTGEFNLYESLNPAVLVPENMTFLQTLEQMRKNHTNLVFILNEYGGVDGLVSTKDILEAVVGDLPEPDEQYDPQIVQRSDGSWLLDGKLMIEVFSELIKVDLEKIKTNHIKTLAGFVITKLKKIPQTGDRFSVYGYNFEVVDMDNNRVDKVLVKRENKERSNISSL
jgi:putative hemolysin